MLKYTSIVSSLKIREINVLVEQHRCDLLVLYDNIFESDHQ